VILSWNASIQSSGGPSLVDGYCVYRSKKHNAAHQKATCSECEQVSAVVITGTTCIDDLVEDDATYYYVVTAVKDKQMSASSNETSAIIPSGTRPSSPTVQSLPSPSCRKSVQDTYP
jgi:hypothetical protein